MLFLHILKALSLKTSCDLEGVCYVQVTGADIKNGLNFIVQGVRACRAAGMCILQKCRATCWNRFVNFLLYLQETLNYKPAFYYRRDAGLLL